MAHGYHAIGIQNGYFPDSSENMNSNSAQKQLYGGSSPVDFEKYANMTGIDGNPYSFWNRIGNFFTGNVSSAEQAYNNYLNDYYNKQTYNREDTAVQRMMADYQAAGINPYIILNSGNVSGSSSSQAQRPDSERTSRKSQERSKSGSILGTALKLLAILALKG